MVISSIFGTMFFCIGLIVSSIHNRNSISIISSFQPQPLKEIVGFPTSLSVVVLSESALLIDNPRYRMGIPLIVGER